MKTRFALSLGLLFAAPQIALAAPLQVSVSIVPQKYFVEKIAGEQANVQVMVPPGGSPATYEPKPQQMAGLAQSQLYFSIGVPFEKAWLQKFQDANPHMTMVHTDALVQKRQMESHHHEDDDAHDEHKHEEHEVHDHHGHDDDNDNDTHDEEDHVIRDPHIWLSPKLVRIQADAIRDALIAQDPKHTVTYRTNHAAFVQEIHTVDQRLLDIFAQQPQKPTFFVFHPSWGYFADDYGLEQHALEIEGKSPSPKTLAQTIEIAKEHHASVIFAQPEFSQKTAQTFARAINGRVVRLSPLAYNWSDNLITAAKAFTQDASRTSR